MANTKLKVGNVPNLRFPGFEGEWEIEKIANVLCIGSGKDYKHLSTGSIPVYGTGGYITSVDKYLHDGESVCIGRKGTINNPFYFNEKFWTVDTLFYTHSFKNILPKFIYYIFQQINWLKYNEASGVPSLSRSVIEQIEINIPKINEQQKLILFLSLIDKKISSQIKIISDLKLLKNTLSKKIFSQQLKFLDADGKSFPVWEIKKVSEIFKITRGNVLSMNLVISKQSNNTHYPVYSSQTKNKGLAGYYNEFLFENAITWTTDGANAGDVNYRSGKFYCTNVCGVLLNQEGYANICIADLINSVSKNYVSYVGNPKLMNGIMGEITIPFPSLNEQKKISKLFGIFEIKIDIEFQLLERLKEQKCYLLANLFI